MKQSCYSNIEYETTFDGKVLDILLKDGNLQYKGKLDSTGALKLNVYRQNGGPEYKVWVEDLNTLVKVLNVIQRARKEVHAD